MREASVEDLDKWLLRVPVIATVHPLVPLSLAPGVTIISDVQKVLRDLDNPSIYAAKPILILSDQADLDARFPHFKVSTLPSAEKINQHIDRNLDYARTSLLTTRKIAEWVEDDVSQNNYDTIIVFLVDGLSYSDVFNWPCELQPCFVDGPSVTFRYREENQNEVVQSIGFPSIIGRPSIYSRLYNMGYRNARGYTYWNRNNVVADYMFSGVPSERVTNFETVLDLLATEDLFHSYIQIMREGLDGLAHSKRELRNQEIQASIRGILNDVERLIKLLREKGHRACIYLTADHGILWKTEHSFKLIKGISNHHPRYAINTSHSKDSDEFSVPFIQDGVSFNLHKYPYLGIPIKANDSGVHGGLSYQESIVPFAKFEVKPKWN
jgi:hypothetical protein